MPITLQANKFIGTLSNLIAQTYVMNFFQTEDLDELIDVFKKGNITYGGGEVVYTVGIPTVQDLNAEQSSLLTVTKPTITEEFIPISNYKVIPLTINNYLMANAFVNENAMSVLIAYLLRSMEVAKKVHVRNAILKALDQATIDIEPTGIEFTGKEITAEMSGLEANATRTYNANALFRLIKAQVKLIGLGKNSENQGKYVSSSDLVVLIGASTYASLEVDTLATLLNSDKITTNVRMVVVEDEASDNVDSNSNIGYRGYVYIVQRSALRFGFNYEVATSFFDASNLNTNHWLHFAYYAKFVKDGIYLPIEVVNFTEE